MKFITPKRVLVLASLILVGFLATRGNRSQIKLKDPFQVKRGTISQTLTISGKIAAQDDVTLRFQASGKLSWVGVKEGDYVRKGQTIATLDQRELKKKLEKYLNLYLKSRHDFDQINADNENTQSDPDQKIRERVKRTIDKYQADLNNAVLDVELQAIAIEYSRLTSPIDGIVVRVGSSHTGVNITPTDAEFEIINPKTVYLLALADQTEISKLKENLTGKLTLDSYVDQEIPGKIIYISFIPDPNETTTSYQIKFSFTYDNSKLIYKIGMTGDLSFTLDEKSDVLFLPSRYIHNDNGKKYVFMLQNKKGIKAPVETGMETDEYVQITSGISENDTVYL